MFEHLQQSQQLNKVPTAVDGQQKPCSSELHDAYHQSHYPSCPNFNQSHHRWEDHRCQLGALGNAKPNRNKRDTIYFNQRENRKSDDSLESSAENFYDEISDDRVDYSSFLSSENYDDGANSPRKKRTTFKTDGHNALFICTSGFNFVFGADTKPFNIPLSYRNVGIAFELNSLV